MGARTTAGRFSIAALVVAVVGALVAAFAPTGDACGGTAFPGGVQGEEVCHHVSMFSIDGSWILVVVSVPVALALIPVLVRHRAARIFSAVLLWACCIVGAWSVGMFFVPAAIVMTVAAARHDEPVSVAR
ncbi:MAG: hypothetical protein ACXVPX_08855 [Actinomycetota bacterium]